MLNNKQLVALVAALFAQEAVALNAHRHAHAQFHAKKDVVYVDDVVTVTDWTTVTVYDDGAPAETPTAKAIFKGAAHSEHYASASPSTTKTSSSKTTTSSLSSTTSTTPKPTTLSTSTIRTSSSTSTTSSSPAAKVQAENAHAQVATTAAAVAATTATIAAAPSISTVAASGGQSSSSSGTSSGSTGRGLAYNSGSLLSPFLGSGTKCSWSYNWDQTADPAAPSNLEFVPMLWGPTHADTWAANAEAAIAKGASNFLSFNECDNPGQCNMDPASAAAAHKQYMNPYSGRVRISTPAITNSQSAGEGVQWLTEFLSACGGSCAYDFCAAHWYNGPDTNDFLSHLVDVHNACGKPVWITEFAPTGSDDQINAFLETVLEQLDNNPTYSFVERYSYFMAGTGSLLSSTSSLSSYGNTYAYGS